MSSSEKRKAIKALENQKTLLDNSNQDDSWIAETSDMLRRYLGENSELYLKMKSFSFTLWYPASVSKEQIMQDIEIQKRKAKQMVERSIAFIKAHGIYKEPKVTAVAVIKANWLVALYFVLSPAIFVFGGWWKYNFTYKEEIQNLQKQNELLNDTIRVLRDSLR